MGDRASLVKFLTLVASPRHVSQLQKRIESWSKLKYLSFSYQNAFSNLRYVSLKCDKPGNTKGGSITVPLTSCLTGLEWVIGKLTIFVCFYLQNGLTQTSQTGGEQYSDTSPFSIPWTSIKNFTHCFIFKILFNVAGYTCCGPFHLVRAVVMDARCQRQSIIDNLLKDIWLTDIGQ